MKFEMKNENRRSEGTAKRYRIELTMTGLMGSGIVLALGLVWVFIFGVLVGRGYHPDTVVPEVATVMPGDAVGQAVPPVSGKDTETGDGKSSDKVIEPEDLAFYDRLKQSGSQPGQGEADTAAQSSGNAMVAAVTSKPESARGEEVVLEQPAVRMAAATPPSLPAAAPAAPAASQSAPASASTPAGMADEDAADQTRYDYVYQVASLSEPQAALRFRDQIRGLGLGAEVRVVRGTDKVWHRVVVLFQGRPIDTRDMKSKLQTVGVDKPLLRSKTPVQGG
jgi:cell division protein FtsN